MKDIIFHVPDDTIIIQATLIQYEEAVGKSFTNFNTGFYDLRGGVTEFTPGCPCSASQGEVFQPIRVHIKDPEAPRKEVVPSGSPEE